ncbi:transcriptional regulator [Streptacidiphilus albus]|uniref:transcriptional regulator n=1 Tax=Streptacidiphilus albus TaxID=105425 RepID=UPI0005A775D3|nr:transcriptional regulator [Streptacidiphilus albus]
MQLRSHHQPDEPDELADRLNHLFSVVHPPHRPPYSTQEVAAAIGATGRAAVSAKYLGELRSGQRRQLSDSRAAAICDFFGVPPRYLTDRETAEQTDQELALLAALRSEDVRHLALRAARLLPEELADVIAGVERCLTAAGD